MKSISKCIFFAITAFLQLSLVQQNLNSQPLQKDYYSMQYADWMLFIPGNDEVKPFYISTKPVTNKEYILYLVWTERVYLDYPQVLINALPGITKNTVFPENFNPFSDTASFNAYLDLSDSYVSDYMFNPAYLNYPVIGISWEQSYRFCTWLSDRYNEYSLIKNKHLIFYPDQIDDYCFTSESFLFGQYEGVVDNVLERDNTFSGFKNVNYLMRPSFHLPSMSELQLCANSELPTLTKSLYYAFEPYSVKGSEFLQLFYDFYLPEKKGFIYVAPMNENEPFYLSSEKPYTDSYYKRKLPEWILDSYLPEQGKSTIEIYKDFGYTLESLSAIQNKNSVELSNLSEPMSYENLFFMPSKDSTGYMPVKILSESPNREFEILLKPEKENLRLNSESFYLYDTAGKTIVNSKGETFTCFRFAVTALKK